jgi:hypothetical protein
MQALDRVRLTLEIAHATQPAHARLAGIAAHTTAGQFRPGPRIYLGSRARWRGTTRVEFDLEGPPI